MDNFERRLAASLKVAAAQRPNVEPVSITSRRSSKRSAFMALAAAVLIGAVIAGTTWLFKPGGSTAPPLNVAPGHWKTIEFEGLRVDIPSTWKPVKANKCEFQFAEHYPETTVCDETPGLRLYGRSLFDPYRQPGVQRTNTSGKAVWSGYIYRGDFAVVASGSNREMVQRVLGSAHQAAASAIDIEGGWKVTALTADDGTSALTGPLADDMYLTFENGSVSGGDGCNGINGKYTQTGDRGQDLTFGSSLSSTTKYCGAPPLYARLFDVRHVSEAGGKLQLQAANWMIIAQLQRVSGYAGPKQPSGLPDAARVTCSTSGIHLDATEIQARPAGVLLVVSSTLPKGSYLTYSSTGGGDSGGEPLPEETQNRHLSLGPGTVTLGCDPVGQMGHGPRAQLRVTDPSGYWRTDQELRRAGCDYGNGIAEWISTYSKTGSTAKEAAEAVAAEFARSSQGRGSSFTAQPATVGYVQAPTQTWLIKRDGRSYVTVLVHQRMTNYSALPDARCDG